jgi:hypothetical protein
MHVVSREAKWRTTCTTCTGEPGVRRPTCSLELATTRNKTMSSLGREPTNLVREGPGEGAQTRPHSR